MKVKYGRILMWLLMLSPILDNINGYLLLSGKSSNISSLYKTIIFLFCMMLMLKSITDKKIIRLIGIIAAVILQFLFFEISNRDGFGYNISSLIKLLMPVVIILSVSTLAIYDKNVTKYVNQVTRFYCWFFPLSLLVTEFLDIGFKTYGSGAAGNKGFYYAGNEISVIMIMILTLEIERYKSNKSKTNFLNMLMGIVSILYIGTKSTYISLLVLIVTAIYTEKNCYKRIMNIVLVLPAFFVGVWYAVNRINAITEIINMIIWKYNTKAANIVNFLLSGRELKLIKAFELGYNENILLKILFGISPNKAENDLKMVIEMDLFDLLLRFGLIVFAVIVVFYVKHLKKVIHTKNKVYVIGISLTYGASLISGHLIFAPMVSIVLAIVLLKIELEEKQCFKYE